MYNSCIQVFAKAPIEGFCKTRLASDIGDKKATRLHAAMIGTTLLNLDSLSDTNNIQLWCKPNISHPFFELIKVKYDISLHNQYGISLGEIMTHAANQALQTGYNKILQIGTDCPSLSTQYISKALERLNTCDIVIGPATDGGYVLLAQKYSHSNIYNNIEWGSDSVLEQLITNIKQQELSFELLNALNDIDTLDDLNKHGKINITL